MVRKIIKQGKEYFECEECSLIYLERGIAEKCENYCKAHYACSIEITKHAVKI